MFARIARLRFLAPLLAFPSLAAAGDDSLHVFTYGIRLSSSSSLISHTSQRTSLDGSTSPQQVSTDLRFGSSGASPAVERSSVKFKCREMTYSIMEMSLLVNLSFPPVRGVHSSLTLKAAVVQGHNQAVSAASKSALVHNKPTSAPVPSKSTSRPSKHTLSGKTPSNSATSKPMSSSRPARKASTKRQYVEIDEDEDEEDKKSGRYKPGSDVTAEDGFDSSEVEDDGLTLGANKYRLEVYGTKRIAATSSMKAVSQAPAKKRKLASSRNYHYQLMLVRVHASY
ncbi:hypothetical protein EDD22DRAFT_1008234 [Suillus occidentalis]|nr:hypothetical protein EDD22DRAFT_1008234 [Suillus occidentalis]